MIDMKLIFKPKYKKQYLKKVEEADLAAFHGEVLHPVYSTFAPWPGILNGRPVVFLEMKDEDEEGVGTFEYRAQKSCESWRGSNFNSND